MRRIIIANNCLSGGGVENVMFNLVNALKKRDYKIVLSIPKCSTKDVTDLFGKEVKLYPPIEPLRKLKRYSLRWFCDRTRFVLQQAYYNVLLFFHHYDAAIAIKEGEAMKKIAPLSAKVKIAWVHADYQFMHWTKRFFSSDEKERQCMQQFDKVVCVSHAAMDSVIETVGDPGNLCVKYNPIDYRQIYKKSTEKIMIERDSSIPLFVSVGRLTYPKNYTLLVDVCARLEKKYKFELWIVGDGKDRAELERKIKAYDMKCVKLLGEQSNPYPYISRADVFISSSTVESYGLAIQEALILGKPVIAIRCPAIEETLHPQFGEIVDNAEESLYAAMERMITNENQRLQYAENIRNFYEEESLYENRLEEIFRLLEA